MVKIKLVSHDCSLQLLHRVLEKQQSAENKNANYSLNNTYKVK